MQKRAVGKSGKINVIHVVYSNKTKAVTVPPIAATPATHPTAIPIITGVDRPP